MTPRSSSPQGGSAKGMRSSRRKPHPLLLLNHQPWCACLADPGAVDCDCGAVPVLTDDQVTFLAFHAADPAPHYWRWMDADGRSVGNSAATDRVCVRRLYGRGSVSIVTPYDAVRSLPLGLLRPGSKGPYLITGFGRAVLAAVSAQAGRRMAAGSGRKSA